jgi:hypothetical protein
VVEGAVWGGKEEMLHVAAAADRLSDAACGSKVHTGRRNEGFFTPFRMTVGGDGAETVMPG